MIKCHHECRQWAKPRLGPLEARDQGGLGRVQGSQDRPGQGVWRWAEVGTTGEPGEGRGSQALKGPVEMVPGVYPMAWVVMISAASTDQIKNEKK